MKSFVCTVLTAGVIAVKTDLALLNAQEPAYSGWMPRDCVDYTFNGVSDQLSIEPRPVQDSFTLAFWVRTTQAGSGYHNWWEGKGLLDGEVPGFVPDFGVSLMADGLIGFGTDSYAW